MSACSGNSESHVTARDYPQNQPRGLISIPGPHSLERSTGSTLQSQFSGK